MVHTEIKLRLISEGDASVGGGTNGSRRKHDLEKRIDQRTEEKSRVKEGQVKEKHLRSRGEEVGGAS